MTESCYLSEEKGLELLEKYALSIQSSSSQKERIENESIPGGDDVNILSELDSKNAVETIDASRKFRNWLDTHVNKGKQNSNTDNCVHVPDKSTHYPFVRNNDTHNLSPVRSKMGYILIFLSKVSPNERFHVTLIL